MITHVLNLEITGAELDINFNWQDFLLLSFTIDNYSNFGASCLVGRNTFSAMNSGTRVKLSYVNSTFEIYPNGNGKVHMRTFDSVPDNSQLKITGIISKT